MTSPRSSPSLRRRWDRLVLQAQGRLDGERSDQVIPWLSAIGLFLVLLALNAATIRSLQPGSGLAPWLQAAWRREHGWAGSPMAGVDPAHASLSLISEPLLWLTRYVPPEALFAVVQAAALALTIIPLWRLARDEAHLRVAAAVVIVVAFALAPTLHRANLSAFHPELIALPALVWAYLCARREQWVRYTALVVVALLCRADLGLTVAALGAVLAVDGRRRAGFLTIAGGVGWSLAALAVLDTATPDQALTPAGEFVARSTAPLAVFPRLFLHPIVEARELLAEPSVLFLVVVLSPLLFLPLVAPRVMAIAAPCLVLAMIADRAVQRVAQAGVLDLAPAAAHIGPAIGFVFVALVFALERIGSPLVVRVLVDRRVLLALLAGATLLFVTESPTSPYRQPWSWGSRDAKAGALLEASDLVDDDDAVATSPSGSALLAERATVVELPPNPLDLDTDRVDRVARTVDAVLLDTTASDLWSGARAEIVVRRFENRGFQVAYAAEGVYLLTRA